MSNKRTCCLLLMLFSTLLISGCVPRPYWLPPKNFIVEEQPVRPLRITALPIYTNNPIAQEFFDDGLSYYLILDYRQAETAFRHAIAADMNCVMCYWGLSLVLNSKSNTINIGFEYQQGYEALQEAIQAIEHEYTPPLEVKLVQALHLRYQNQILPAFRTTNDNGYFTYDQSYGIIQNYADAIGRLIDHAPATWETELKLLYVMAQLEANDWQAWTYDHQPLPETSDLINLVNDVLRADPDNPSAHLFKVKLLQDSNNPERARNDANFLLDVATDEGTLPITASVYFGKMNDHYNESLAAETAIQAYEQQYREDPHRLVRPDFLYQLSFYQLARSAAQLGDIERAMGAARALRARIYPQDYPYVGEDAIMDSEIYFVITHFGRWERALIEPKPLIDHPFLQASWHYMRGMAYATLYYTREAQGELDQIREIKNELPSPNMLGHQYIDEMELVIRARILSKLGQESAAEESLREAKRVEAKAKVVPLPVTIN